MKNPEEITVGTEEAASYVAEMLVNKDRMDIVLQNIAKMKGDVLLKCVLSSKAGAWYAMNQTADLLS